MEDKWIYLLIGVAIVGVPLLLYLFASGGFKRSVSNIEVWEVVKDWRGRTVGVKIHRRVVEG
jgi:hypothetical protein